MFHKIKNVFPANDYILTVQFSEGVSKEYDLKLLFERIPAFKQLQNHEKEFFSVSVDTGGYGIVWNDELDLSFD